MWLFLLLAILLFGVWKLFELRFASGDIYPQYSSLRADPQGTRALFDSLAELPGFQVTRNFHPLDQLATGRQVVFYLGISPYAFEQGSEEEFQALENLASGGGRVIVGFRPVQPESAPKNRDKYTGPTPLRLRWHIDFAYLNKLDPFDRDSTSLVFVHADPAWHGTASLLERRFGSGAIVLAAQPHPLSNQGLQKRRRTDLIAWMLGDNQRVVFDESHLGVIESGSVAGLARKYHLEPAFAALLALAGLFIWKNSASFLPTRETSGAEDPVLSPAKDAASGLANLLERNIPESDLIGTCVAQWEHDHGGQRDAAKLARVRAIAAQPGDPAALYREITQFLSSHRSNE